MQLEFYSSSLLYLTIMASVVCKHSKQFVAAQDASCACSKKHIESSTGVLELFCVLLPSVK